MIAQQGYVVVYGSPDWGDDLITLGVSNLLQVTHPGKRLLVSVTLERGSLVGVIRPGGGRILGVCSSREETGYLGLSTLGAGRIIWVFHYGRRKDGSLGSFTLEAGVRSGHSLWEKAGHSCWEKAGHSCWQKAANMSPLYII